MNCYMHSHTIQLSHNKHMYTERHTLSITHTHTHILFSYPTCMHAYIIQQTHNKRNAHTLIIQLSHNKCRHTHALLGYSTISIHTHTPHTHPTHTHTPHTHTPHILFNYPTISTHIHDSTTPPPQWHTHYSTISQWISTQTHTHTDNGQTHCSYKTECRTTSAIFQQNVSNKYILYNYILPTKCSGLELLSTAYWQHNYQDLSAFSPHLKSCPFQA